VIDTRKMSRHRYLTSFMLGTGRAHVERESKGAVVKEMLLYMYDKCAFTNEPGTTQQNTKSRHT
jgi:hypothetical protein